ncbi:Erv29p [Sugiyamaella lignohabitans]|uniref:Erv29p n=1 Tax=Sugiyamaella lignohabitans TaxID=796027 RepID=A0A161HIJ0_9ASCO|nr:Erv29p [Sugiyamaella lignohabitans]ANB10958.1 Erv29p [Sugiyamaella lignohabitans]
MSNRYQMPLDGGDVKTRRQASGGISGYDSAPMGGANFSSYPGAAASSPSFARRAHEVSEKIDNFLGTVGTPVKPYLPGIGRFLIIATFVEDAFRIVTQWSDQVGYIWNVRGLPHIIAVLFLSINVVAMLIGSFSVVFKKRLEIGVGALLFVVVSQALVYGLIFKFSFFFRNVSLVGGLLIVLSDAFVRDRRSLSLPGLPVLEDKDRSKYLQLAGRILLIFLFIAYMVTRNWTVIGGFFNVIGLVACIMVVVGFKARLSASLLVVLLSVQNLLTNPYWRYASRNPARDLLRYEYFQTLSIVGGLILLVSSGAGRISIDEKKKIY